MVAIVDYGMGNLFSVKHACEHVGLRAIVTESRDDILASQAVILPGIGAFADAIAALRARDLVSVLRDIADSPTPLVGICLGMQLLMSESYEFGRHRGLGIIEGDVVRFNGGTAPVVKVPQVGWNRVSPAGRPWEQTLLADIAAGEFMYFVHSFYVRPADGGVVLSTTRYGETEFCSSLARGNLFACQFHPERSGPQGLRMYRTLAALLQRTTCDPEDDNRATGSQVRTA